MPVAKAKRVWQGGEARPRRPRRESGRDFVRSSDFWTARGEVDLKDGTSCVIVPQEDYERLVQIAEERELVGVLEDPNTKWLDWEDCKLRLAGSAIGAARKAKKLTQAQVAKKLGLPQSQISRIERNPDRTTVRTLKRIARALGVNVKQLVE